jgi:hypothetical protein
MRTTVYLNNDSIVTVSYYREPADKIKPSHPSNTIHNKPIPRRTERRSYIRRKK